MPKKKGLKMQVKEQILNGEDGEEYDRYLKEHQKKLRRLERELTGDNMETPPDYGY